MTKCPSFRLLFAFLILALFPGPLAAETYEQDFDNFANGTTALGDGSVMAGSAKVQNLALQLTEDGGSSGFGSFTIPALAGSSSGWTATFDLTITDSAGSNAPADGFSFNYGNFAPGILGSAEEGMANEGAVTSNISFEIDSWMNFDAEQGVNLAEKNGSTTTDLGFNNGPILNDGTSVGGAVTITYDPANGVSFSTEGLLTNANFSDLALTSFMGDDNYHFAFSGRVGGANQTVSIDNLVVITSGSSDNDNDGLPNTWEIANGLDPDIGTGDDGPNGDPDADLLTNLEEFNLGTDPQDSDSDDDLLLDGVETMTGIWNGTTDTGTNPLIADTDNDGLDDSLENPDLPFTGPGQPGTDPNIRDTDSDGVRDGDEIASGRDPTVAEPVGDIIISEFMASNSSGLTDLDGDTPDWIEIHNNGTVAVDLVGWHLTDDPSSPTKWTFPSRTLEPGGFLIVFASGKNLTGAELHTNFKLSAGGEYLGLLKPDSSVSHEYAPTFPPQLTDISFGVEMTSTSSDLIDDSASAKYLVPSDGSLGLTWTGSGFVDSAWNSGTNGLGYDQNGSLTPFINTDLQAALQGNNSGAYIRLPFDITGTPDFDSLMLDLTYDDGFTAYLNGVAVGGDNAPEAPLWNSSSLTENSGGFLVNDFTQAEVGYALVNHSSTAANIIGGADPFLRLIYEGRNSNFNCIHFDRTEIGPFGSVTAEFDFRMSGLADGFSILLLPTSTYGTTSAQPGASAFTAEEPNLPGVFAVGFDIWNGIDEISLHYGFPRAAQNLSGSIDLNSNLWHRAQITLVPDGTGSRVTVSVIPNVRGAAGAPVVFHNNVSISDLSPYEYRLQFAGRTGGATTNVDLDAINVNGSNGAGGALNTIIDLSDQIGLLQSGTNVLALHGVNHTSSDVDFFTHAALSGVTVSNVNTGSLLYFDAPTNGAPNVTGSTGIAGPVTIFPSSGTFTGNQAVTLTTTSPDNQIRYTTDGSVPGLSSTLYTTPINLTTSTRIRARAFTTDNSPGPSATANYFRIATDLQTFSSDLPIVVVDNFGAGGFPGAGSSFQPMVMAVFDRQPDDGRSALTDAPQLITRGGAHKRGSSTAGQSKPNLRIETWGETDDEDVSVDLLDFPKESDFILYAPYSFDRAFMRNAFMYHLSNEIGQYAVRTRFVEVFANTGGGDLSYASDYHGVYVLMESIKRDNDRVDVEKLEPGNNAEPEITGGYIWKVDRGSPSFTTVGQSDQQVIEDPDPVTAAQNTYLQNYLNAFGTALTGPNSTDPVNGYAPYIDQPSWVDHHILNVLAFNVDALRLSTFLHKDRNKPIVKGPIWDFDRSLESYDSRDNNPQTWGSTGGTQFFQRGWYDHLFDDPDFAQQWIDRWRELRKPGGSFSDAELFAVLDSMEAEVTEAAPRNYARWTSVGPNNGGSLAGEVQNIQDWLALRTAWIDSQLTGNVTMSQAGGQIPTGTQITLSGPAGAAIYYTLDGTDPRGNGGGFTGTLYSGPITINTSSRLVARAYDSSKPTALFDSRWGAPSQETYLTGGVVAASAANLVITEVHYHPAPPTLTEANAGYTDADDFEFLEFLNLGGNPIDLVDCHFDDGIDFTFPLNSVILPGDRLVLAKNPGAFLLRYGAGIDFMGSYQETSLSNDGESIRLLASNGSTITGFTYNDVWYGPTDGTGYSLELRNPSTIQAELSQSSSWGISCDFGGTPGEAGLAFSQAYQVWARDHFSAAELDDSNISGGLIDIDGDGFNNLIEYALNLDPRSNSSGQGPSASFVKNRLSLTFKRWQKAIGLSYIVEVSDDLENWNEATLLAGPPTDHGDGTETVTLSDSELVSGEERRFIRLRIVEN